MQVRELLEKYSPQAVVEVLASFLTEERITRIDRVLKKRVNGVQVALESPADIHNALAVTRTGEALGLSHFHLIDAQLVKGQGKSTMRGSGRWIHLHKHETLEDFRSQMKGFTLAGASLEGELMPETLPVDKPLCLLFGNERQGLTKEALESCDLLYKIPMCGMVESFNLSVSAAISLYTVMKRKEAALNGEGDLSFEAQLEEKACYYVRSIGIKVARDILKRR